MVLVVIWFLDHFALEHVPSMNAIWIITPSSLLHVWVTRFKTFFVFFKLPILTSNNVIWVDLFATLFDEAQHVVKISATGYVPVFYEVINLLFFFFPGLPMLLIEPQTFLLMFFICKLKGLDTTCKIFNFHCMQLITKLLPNMRK